jgi:predicted nuclease of predicted toxin-antitoxin system
MKPLLDQGLPRSAVALLSQERFDTVHVGDVGLSEADDAAILQWSRAHDRAVITLDSDFHTLLALSGANSPSAVRIRIEGLRPWPWSPWCRTCLANAPKIWSTARL